MENCHATLMLRIPRKRYAGVSNAEGACVENSPMLVNYVEYYRDWGEFAQEYYDVSMGRRGRFGILLLRRMMSERRRSDSTLSPDGNQALRVVPVRA